ncbi:acyl-CoA thioesterase II [Novosphingobium sp. SG720]|uniref:acyl-CoA thioesterase n=1 Tax=Novosphingobium sp. SG720 TaxID=2586998 RepID=UPI001445FEE8|nr:acyl-CoA thioesterase II [Novosphingobium sp. SG720]NKJ40979.1 acyl-CoA thioesterase-2 [Novosphingobium sp. SG720]
MLHPLSTTLLSDSHDPAVIAAGLARLLTVAPEAGTPDAFLGARKPGGVGRVFGGQIVAQGLAAAQATVAADRPVHSLHAYFLRPGSEDREIRYTVLRDLDGNNFANRRVVASQGQDPIFTMTASFHRRGEGVQHGLPMPAVPAPDDLPSEADLLTIYADRLSDQRRALLARPRAIEMRPAEPLNWLRDTPAEPVAHTWLRCVAPLPDDPALHRAVIAYISDMTLLGTSMLPHGISGKAGTAKGASLDHALWFHADARADQWLLYACDSPWAGQMRGFSRGRIFTQDGRLVAQTAQEGLVHKLD